MRRGVTAYGVPCVGVGCAAHSFLVCPGAQKALSPLVFPLRGTLDVGGGGRGSTVGILESSWAQSSLWSPGLPVPAALPCAFPRRLGARPG